MVVNFDKEIVKQTCRLADWICDPSRLKDGLTHTNNRVSEVFRKNKKRGVLSSQMITSHDNTR
jgi:hypothetical protein